MKKLLKIYVLLFVVLITGCSSNSYTQISDKEAYSMMVTKEVVILDVRTPEEFENGHLEEAINIPVDQVKELFPKEVTKDKEQIIIVYCQSGKRAKEASKTLANLKYTNVYTFGGINNWSYEIE